MTIDPAAVLALISDLTVRLAQVEAERDALAAELQRRDQPTPTARSTT